MIEGPDIDGSRFVFASEEWWVMGLFGYLMVPIIALLAGRRWDWLVRCWGYSVLLFLVLTVFGLI